MFELAFFNIFWLELFSQVTNHQFLSCGGILAKIKLCFSVGIWVLRKVQKVLIILTYIINVKLQTSLTLPVSFSFK